MRRKRYIAPPSYEEMPALTTSDKFYCIMLGASLIAGAWWLANMPQGSLNSPPDASITVSVCK